MTPDPMTLYKLMILYMLKQSKLPLSFGQISEFMVGKEYTNPFTLQEALNDLQEAHLARLEITSHRSNYELTREGEDTLSYFGKEISDSIVTDINAFLQDNKVRLRTETGCFADYTTSGTSDYIVTCGIREGRGTLIRLELAVPTEKQAEVICENWPDASQRIYAFTMKELFRDN